jgi:hypothetical protein
MIVRYLRQLIEMNNLSELSLRCRSVLSTTFDGKVRCHQNLREIEYPPQLVDTLQIHQFGVGKIEFV